MPFQRQLTDEQRVINRRESYRRWKAKTGYSWRKRNPEKAQKQEQEYRQRNYERDTERQRIWLAKNPGKAAEYSARWQKKNPSWQRKYNATHKEVLAAARRKNEGERYATDPAFKMLKNIRSRLAKELRKATTDQKIRVGKTAKTVELLGCSIKDFVIYIESRWESGMNWQNYGCTKDSWSVDHELPFAIFDLTKPEHQKRACHFSNLKPMWHVENMRKGDKTNFHPNNQTENSAQNRAQ